MLLGLLLIALELAAGRALSEEALAELARPPHERSEFTSVFTIGVPEAHRPVLITRNEDTTWPDAEIHTYESLTAAIERRKKERSHMLANLQE